MADESGTSVPFMPRSRSLLLLQPRKPSVSVWMIVHATPASSVSRYASSLKLRKIFILNELLKL